MVVLSSPSDTEQAENALAGFHPAVSTWFARHFADGPSEPQSQGWPHIRSGTNTLIAAPTGSGKTLAGFLVAIDSLYRRHAEATAAAVSGLIPRTPLRTG